MTNQKLIRGTVLAAAMTISAANATTAFGFQQGQYQPGQPGEQIPQGNTSVTRELNRMFQESGQQMPSMNAQELPNANVPTQGQIRLRQPQNQAQPGTQPNSYTVQPAAGAKNPGLLSRFFGKLRGNSNNKTSPNDMNYRPPVPPDYQNTTPSTAAAGTGIVQPQGQTPFPQKNQPAQNVPRSATVQTNHKHNPGATEPARSSPQDSTHFRNGAMSRIPPRSGSTVKPANTASPVSSSAAVAGDKATYTQPGSAPGFMSTAGASTVIHEQTVAAPPVTDEFQEEFIRDNTGRPTESHAIQEKVASTPAASVAAKDAVNGFENPFLDSYDSTEATELLDLDSLIEIPGATPRPIAAEVGKTIQAAPVAEITAEFKTPPTQKATSDRELQESAAASANVLAEGPIETQDENPFTGVQLETSDADFFAGQERATGVESDSFGTPVTPMEDFSSELPAIVLPPVEEADTTDVEAIDPISAPESTASDSARTESRPSADIPAAMSAADTERLRQTADQDHRQRQRRQILVRAGQQGFKGFCPVELRERRELVESNPQFTSTFGLQTYTFSSAESKIAFDTDPSRYVPAAGGSDVVVLVNSGEEQAGQLDYALWYRDRLYLFRSRETMTLFSKDPQRFASQY